MIYSLSRLYFPVSSNLFVNKSVQCTDVLLQANRLKKEDDLISPRWAQMDAYREPLAPQRGSKEGHEIVLEA